MRIKAAVTDHKEVTISTKDVVYKIYQQIFANIRPESTKKFDDWHIDSEGYVVGETDCMGRGTNLYTRLEKASIELLRDYTALKIWYTLTLKLED